MKRILITTLALLTIASSAAPLAATSARAAHADKNHENRDSIPRVLPPNHADLVESKLRHEAVLAYAQHQLPENKAEWEKLRTSLKNEIIKKAGIVIDHKLPLNYQETGVAKVQGLTIKNIVFQTRPGVYATANLYIPDGKGPFPAVINMHGHWSQGRLAERVQERGFSLALNGYVCLSIDAFGSGERATEHGLYEYHGANLGAHLMNVGESLLGFQVSDNMRAVDLLCSLPYVDPDNIGATGASGGGNQTMWLTAIDDRIKASMPVVSVGTFESAVMRSNCICELLIDGLTFTETSGVLALVAPRAIKMCNHHQDSNPTFYPAEMQRSYDNARRLFSVLGAENKISYQLFDLKHGYWPEDREAMLGWFDLHLKGTGTGAPKKEVPFTTLPEEKVMVFAKGKRPDKVESVADYVKRKGNELRESFLTAKTFNVEQKKKELSAMLRLNKESNVKQVHRYSEVDGWKRFALETSDNKLIPVVVRPARATAEYVIISHPGGKDGVPGAVVEELSAKGIGIVIPDLSGTGEAASGRLHDRVANQHTLSRAELWLGKSILGEWVTELDLVTKFTKAEFNAANVRFDGTKDAGLAGLFLTALGSEINEVNLREAPVSYLFDNREGVDYFSMAIHLPGFLSWGDVSLAAALSGKKIKFIDPVTMSGQRISKEKQQTYDSEFKKIRALCRTGGETVFANGALY